MKKSCYVFDHSAKNAASSNNVTAWQQIISGNNSVDSTETATQTAKKVIFILIFNLKFKKISFCNRCLDFGQIMAKCKECTMFYEYKTSNAPPSDEMPESFCILRIANLPVNFTEREVV